ncbi:hypothetical protein CODIS_36860 [Candidatus Thiodiazotropha endolucinida]|uniref:Uncharacterized protein n=1 Tax=Candidatus Thiodiazotropha endolucinida TaxID=1655433 RepID=A0A7Z1ADN1_9GAMM|nr:hypothetical protein CODIS_36860 [Candidatus Thiodiazotropha endolucinida]
MHRICAVRRGVDDLLAEAGNTVETRRLIDRADVHIHSAKIDIGAATGTGVAVVVDRDVDRVGVVAGCMCRTVQVGDIAGGIKIVVQIRQRAGEGQDLRCASDRDAGAGRRTQVAADAGGQGDRQRTAAGVDIREVDGRQIDVARDILGHTDIARQGAGVGRIVVDRAHSNRGVVVDTGTAIAVSEYKAYGACARGRVFGVGVFVGDVANERGDRSGIGVGIERDDQIGAAAAAGEGTDLGTAVADGTARYRDIRWAGALITDREHVFSIVAAGLERNGQRAGIEIAAVDIGHDRCGALIDDLGAVVFVVGQAVTTQISDGRDFVVRRDIDIDRAEVDVRTATGAGVAVVVDRDVDRVGIVTVGVWCTVQVGDIARGIEVVVQVGQRAGQGPGSARSTDRNAGAGGGAQVAAGAGGQGHGQGADTGIDITEVNRRQIDIGGNILCDGDVGRQGAGVGRIVVDRGDGDGRAAHCL